MEELHPTLAEVPVKKAVVTEAIISKDASEIAQSLT